MSDSVAYLKLVASFELSQKLSKMFIHPNISLIYQQKTSTSCTKVGVRGELGNLVTARRALGERKTFLEIYLTLVMLICIIPGRHMLPVVPLHSSLGPKK